MADIFTDPKTDKTDKRKLGLSTEGKANDFVVKLNGDEYGFWIVSREHGQVPEYFQGHLFTTAAHAEQAIREYLDK